jgi:ABC-type transport system involved in multi-copper enzyme maturation permease subunit
VILHGALSVFRFEVRRTLTWSRIAVWIMLILFPVFIVSVMKYYEEDLKSNLHLEGRTPRSMRKFEQMQRQADRAAGTPRPADAGQEAADQPEERQPPSPLSQLWGAVFFGLIPEVITLFGLLLWVPPLVHAELEGRTWIYLAVRPRGRVSVLLGKYLTAVAWTALAGWISTTVCVCIVRPEDPFRLWWTMVALVGIASVSYGAIYSLIGVALHRRAMVIAVGYTLIFEFLVSLIPAVINKLTVQYRLRGLLFTWMDWRGLISPQAGEVLLGTEPAWLHLLILCGGVVVTLVVAVQVIQRKEYATVSDN